MPVTKLEVNCKPMSVNEQLSNLENKMHRTSNFLRELKALSKICEDVSSSGSETNEKKEKQVFVRRVLQLCAEIQDARDVIHNLVENRLSPRQKCLLTFTDPLHDPEFDPSIRFFGIDWEQIFGKCFSVSINIKIFSKAFLDLPPDSSMDILLLNTILRDLSRIETDITSHAEAVLHGRLSKSQQQLIKEETLRISSIVPPPHPKCRMSKSKSFRDSSNHRSYNKYKKNKTTDLFKLSEASNSVSHVPDIDIDKERQKEPIKRKNSFIQQFSAIFKNIR